MKKDYTHISVILDRTGSMESIRDDTIGGFNAFLEDQQHQPGTATLTLVQFDTEDPYEIVHHYTPIADIPKLTRKTYVPRAATPLLDALGRGINDLEKGILELAEEERPSKVVMVVITDGHENSSEEFKKDQISKMVKERTEKDDWQFVFLGADLDGIDDARASGFVFDSSLLYEKSGKGAREAWASLSKRTSEFRSDRAKKIGFERSDRKHPDDPDKES
jgi:hypothetical protein